MKQFLLSLCAAAGYVLGSPAGALHVQAGKGKSDKMATGKVDAVG